MQKLTQYDVEQVELMAARIIGERGVCYATIKSGGYAVELSFMRQLDDAVVERIHDGVKEFLDSKKVEQLSLWE